MAARAQGGNIILGVSGSIAAYKACSVLRGLTAKRHTVRVVMTEAAQHLVGPATFRALSGQPVVTGLWVQEASANLVHIELAEWADVLAIVPATANIIGKAACGIADEILSTTWMACDCPKVIAPAMNDRMWANPAVQENFRKLSALSGVYIIEPVEGRLASGKVAKGHLAPVGDIVEKIDSVVCGS